MVDVCSAHDLVDEGVCILEGMVDALEALLEIALGELCGAIDVELPEELADALVTGLVAFHGDYALLPRLGHAMPRTALRQVHTAAKRVVRTPCPLDSFVVAVKSRRWRNPPGGPTPKIRSGSGDEPAVRLAKFSSTFRLLADALHLGHPLFDR